MINCIKKLFHIGSPNIASLIFSEKLLRSIDCRLKALTFPARPNIVYESVIIQTNQIVIHQSVNHPISDGSYTDLSSFIIQHLEPLVCAVSV